MMREILQTIVAEYDKTKGCHIWYFQAHPDTIRNVLGFSEIWHENKLTTFPRIDVKGTFISPPQNLLKTVNTLLHIFPNDRPMAILQFNTPSFPDYSWQTTEQYRGYFVYPEEKVSYGKLMLRRVE